MRDHRVRLPSVFSALLLFGAAGLLAMVIAFSAGGGLQRPLSSPARQPAVAAPPVQTATPTANTGAFSPATPTPTLTPACTIAFTTEKHHRNERQACATPTPQPGDNGD